MPVDSAMRDAWLRCMRAAMDVGNAIVAGEYDLAGFAVGLLLHERAAQLADGADDRAIGRVGRELDERAAPAGRLVHRPADHLLTQPPAAVARRHPHRLHLSAHRAAPRQPRQEAQLHRPHDRVADDRIVC